MGDSETEASASAESTLGYHSWSVGVLTCGLESGRGTVLGGQFDWGGRLPKSNGGAQRYSQNGWKSFIERKRRRVLDCERDNSSRDESRS